MLKEKKLLTAENMIWFVHIEKRNERKENKFLYEIHTVKWYIYLHSIQHDRACVRHVLPKMKERKKERN